MIADAGCLSEKLTEFIKNHAGWTLTIVQRSEPDFSHSSLGNRQILTSPGNLGRFDRESSADSDAWKGDQNEPKERYSMEQIIGFLREAEVLLSKGRSLAMSAASSGFPSRVTTAGERHMAV